MSSKAGWGAKAVLASARLDFVRMMMRENYITEPRIEQSLRLAGKTILECLTGG
jgi:hypothetical protein